MARGPKPVSPALQEAKGNPRQRGRQSLTKQRVEELAALDPIAPPAFLAAPRRKDKTLNAALAIWRELAGDLRKRHLLDKLGRHPFARWCVYQAEWIEATKTIAAEGITRVVKTVSGDEMPRRHPAAAHRDRVELQMANLEAAFGLTPADRYKVLRDQNATPLGGLFGRDEGTEPAADKPAEPNATSPVSFMAERAALPPGTRPN
ncbi:phage terminase small subunit P27 family [Methylobacterium gnaphalii]|uniref:Terminase n=1 Tax=Methylobacterium gnaphalii TaxID=1010610 RepID=A0A512JQN3_9HYPH|nr:phage terminase small subunit P27 family [Methylobacterium gnaphalii]GEP12266.1 hypothetical protein MGN01_41110 [Methylobacterium gnaphalii]GJD68730.1 hypothetical protein MMMDOFMJ_1654 [Methylobacterium gnaphalii]GLS49373.1 hypothetical protein GCM10007885_22210 [Methylobacterium gnaphalii]